MYLLRQRKFHTFNIINGNMETILWMMGKTYIWRIVTVAILDFYEIKVSNCISIYPNRLLDLKNL